jgi:CO/xanthine dehydrogenase FAD-binding subunit
MSNNSIFADLAALRLAPDSATLVGSREVFTHVPVRKPNRTDFFRVHPDPDMSLVTAVFLDKEENQCFFVTPKMRDAMLGEVRPVLLLTTITRQGVVMIWPMRIAVDGARRDAWAETSAEAAELSKRKWIRMPADKGLGGYRIYEAQGELSEPVWPDKTLQQLLEIAFRDRVIDSEDHPVVRRLRGLT